MSSPPEVLNQHVIDPVICIRCNTCEETCPIDAVTHDSRNYVVNADVCNACRLCISPCPTGAIDNWRTVLKAEAYPIEEQLEWDDLPAQADLGLSGSSTETADFEPPELDTLRGSAVPPASAAKPTTNLYTVLQPAIATVTGNFRVTSADFENDAHHIVLDFGSQSFPVLEGQSIGIIPPGEADNGRPHHARQYSVASPRDGERPKYNNLSLTVKRVTADRDGRQVNGVASNYVCDLAKGDQVSVIGPFGSTFLMPDDPSANLLMACTGTGSAPMRAMTERRRRRREPGDGRLMLFFGARTPDELPYFGPLMQLPKDFIDINLAFSRVSDSPKIYVQDAMRERSEDIGKLLADDHTYIFVCGVRGMEDGVLEALDFAATSAGLDWPKLHAELKSHGRIHLETY